MKVISLAFLIFFSSIILAQKKDTTNMDKTNKLEIINTKQTDSNIVNYWINIGTFPRNENLSIHYSFNFAFKNLAFSAMLLGTGEFFGPNSDGYSTSSITTSIGYNITERYYLFSFLQGLV